MERFYYAWIEGRMSKIRFIWFKGRPYLVFFWDEIHWDATKLMDYSKNEYHEFIHNYYIPAWQWKGHWFDEGIKFMMSGLKREVKEEMENEIAWNHFIYHPFKRYKRDNV